MGHCVLQHTFWSFVNQLALVWCTVVARLNLFPIVHCFVSVMGAWMTNMGTNCGWAVRHTSHGSDTHNPGHPGYWQPLLSNVLVNPFYDFGAVDPSSLPRE